MYNFGTNKLCIHDMQGIFSKRTNLTRSIHRSKDFSRIYKNGFRFHGIDKKPISNDEILCSNYNVIKISRRIEKWKMSSRKEYYIKNKMIHCITPIVHYYETKTLFDIIGTPLRDPSNHFYMRDCRHTKNCVVGLLFPEKIHFHAKYVDDEDSIGEREIILILV
uniref:Uncharacterized protein n=1 Tax=viral metagenome TaxID=1070528 RepID=A0A6C0C900_9ZZZZ